MPDNSGEFPKLPGHPISRNDIIHEKDAKINKKILNFSVGKTAAKETAKKEKSYLHFQFLVIRCIWWKLGFLQKNTKKVWVLCVYARVFRNIPLLFFTNRFAFKAGVGLKYKFGS